MPDTVDLSVCIVNWNTRGLLRNCLESLYRTVGDKLDLEVIVTDNASVDGSVEMLRDEFPYVSVIANAENRGFGPACNQCVEVSSGRHILFLNSDTIVLPGALEAMVQYLDDHPSAGGVGCRLLNADGSLQRSCWYGFTSLRSAIIDAFYLWRLMPQAEFVRASEVVTRDGEPVAVDHLLGACLVVPRRVLDSVGGFDPRFFMFLEETDLCYRIRQRGLELYYLPAPAIIHLGGQSTSQVPSMKRRLYRSQCLFLRKHGASSTYMVAYKAVTVLAACVRVGLWTFRASIPPRRREAARFALSYARALVEVRSY